MSKQNNMRSINWRQRGWRSVGWKNSDVTVEAPADSILHWDADIDAFSEQTGGVHRLNHAVLGPQYVLNADGSYTNAGAVAPVDVIGGRKMLRTCGAVTNPTIMAFDPMNVTRVVATGNMSTPSSVLTVTESIGAGTHEAWRILSPAVSSGTYTLSIRVKRGVGGRNFKIAIIVSGGTSVADTIYDMATGLKLSGAASAPATLTLNNGWWIGSFTVVVAATPSLIGYLALVDGTTTSYIGDGISSLQFSCAQLTASAYPLPYTPPGTTMPASNATTTNGAWFALPNGSPLWQALTGQPLTLATRVRMGVGSGDLGANTALEGISCAASGGTVMRAQDISGSKYPATSDDGTTSALSPATTWSRNAVMRRFVQVNTAGTQFRVGYMIEGTHTVIQWGSWTAFDGSFNPSTLYRLLLGYNNASPMWFNKITAWKKQVTDAEILEALS